jgi:hypothetical protein
MLSAMTLGICYQCGAPKRGALLAFPVHRLEPDSPQDMTTSLTLTSHFFTASDLVQANRDYKVGKKSELNEEILQAMRAHMGRIASCLGPSHALAKPETGVQKSLNRLLRLVKAKFN